MEFAFHIYVLVLGLAAGSFLNVIIYRLPRRNQGLTLTRPRRSFCPECGASISWFDNIPILSWFILRGKCRNCQKIISAQYPLVELLSGGMALYLFTACSSVPAFLMQYYFALCLLAITFIDLEHLVIPMVLVYPTIALGLVSAWAYPMAPPALEFTGPWLWLKLRLGPGGVSLANSLAGLALGWGGLKALSLAYKKVRGREGLGEGDPALLGLIGAFLGWLALPGILLAASIIGLIAAFIFINLRGQAKPAGGWGHMPVPFGFFLAITALHFLRPWNGGG